MTPETVGREAVKRVRERLAASWAALYLTAPGTSEATDRIRSPEGPDDPGPLPESTTQALLRFCLASTVPLTTPDLLGDSRMAVDDGARDVLAQAVDRAVLAVPARAIDRVVGVLFLRAPTGRTFTAGDVELAEVFATQAALAVDNGRVHAEAAKRRREADELAASGRFLTETLDPDIVGRRIVDSVKRLFGVRSAGLRLREADGAFVQIASASDDGPYMAVGHRSPAGRGLSQLIVDSARALRVPDLALEDGLDLTDDVRERMLRSDERALLAVPLRDASRVIGTLSITAPTGRVFTDDEVALLQAFGDQAAVALQNSLRHAEMTRRQRESEELAHVARLVSETVDLATVAERIAERVLDLLHVNSSAIRLLQPDGSLAPIATGGLARSYASAEAVVPPGAGLVGRAVVEGIPVWTSDIRVDARFPMPSPMRDRNAQAGIVAGLAVPLRVAGTVIGVASVGVEAPRVFTDAEIQLLQTFADHAAVALDNVRKRDDLAKHAERLRILHDIDRGLIAEQSSASIAAAVVRPLRELLGVPRVIVNLFDLERGEVEWLAAAGRRRIHLGPGIIRYSLALAGDVEALRRGEPQTIDASTFPKSPETDALLTSGVRYYMVVPMIAGGELIGSVSFGGPTAGPFPAEQVAIVQEAATQLAIALAQARLHERLARQAAELERRVEERTGQLSAINAELGSEITERRRAQAEADQANQAKSEFLSRMSHELRTPLNAILGFGQLLESDALSADQQEGVGFILRAGRHLLDLVNEVLDITRIEAGSLRLSLEPVPVFNLLRDTLELVRPLAAAADVRLESDAVDPHLHVRADRQRLQQVMLNLLSNALKYNRPGGTVRTSAEPAADGRLRLHVTDSGRGMTAEQIARLFTPFDRLGAEATGVEGTGLGLALSKHLAEAMGGEIEVQSRVGVGSRFTVTLAVAEAPGVAEPAAAGVAPASATPAPVRMQVLYIEDNVSNLRLVERIVAMRPGVKMIPAMQGRVGLALALQHRPDLILLDQHLPDMRGDEVLHALRADVQTRDIPVVMLSADAIPRQVRALLDAGACAYLTKPLDIPRLLEVLDGVIRPEPA